MVVKSRVLVKRSQSYSQQFVLNVYLSHFGLFFLLLLFIFRAGGGFLSHCILQILKGFYCFVGLATLLWQVVRQENP